METWITKNSANWSEPVVVHASYEAATAYAVALHKSGDDIVIDTENKTIHYHLAPLF